MVQKSVVTVLMGASLKDQACGLRAYVLRAIPTLSLLRAPLGFSEQCLVPS